MRSIPSDRLERWYGAEYINHVSRSMRGFYGPKPIPVGHAPGKVLATNDGDFIGSMSGGGFASRADLLRERGSQIWKRWHRQQYGKLSGFAGLVELQTQARTRGQTIMFQKTRVSPGVGRAQDMWAEATIPQAGAAGAAAPGGTAHTSADTGAIPFKNAEAGETQHITGSRLISVNTTQTAPDCILLIDRLFSVAKTMNSTATEAVTGVPTRYQGTTAGADDSAENNILFIMNPTTVLPATAHNWTVCLYTDQAGGASTLPSVTGVSACIQHSFDMPLNQWFCPLATGDKGIQQLDQMQCSALVASGTITFAIGHPLVWMPQMQAAGAGAAYTDMDAVLSCFSLARVFDNACLDVLDTLTLSGNNQIKGNIKLAPG
jgi:hypothetical protein